MVGKPVNRTLVQANNSLRYGLSRDLANHLLKTGGGPQILLILLFIYRGDPDHVGPANKTLSYSVPVPTLGYKSLGYVPVLSQCGWDPAFFLSMRIRIKLYLVPKK